MKTLSLFCFLLQMIFAPISAWAGEESISIDHAYYRKVHDDDNGTVHMFLANKGEKEITISKIYLNGVLMEDMPNDLAVWYQAVPEKIGPDKVSDVMVKLRHPTKRLINIAVETMDGQRYERVMQPITDPLRLTFIGFSDDLTKLYIYLQNDGEEPLSINKVYLNTQDITSSCTIPWKNLKPGEKQCIAAEPKSKLSFGQYIAIKVETREEITTEALVRVYTFFPIQGWGGDNRPEFYFNQDNFDMHYSPGSFSKSKQQPHYKVYHVLDDPACGDKKKAEGLGSNAKEVIARAMECRKQDPVHSTIIYACEFCKPRNYFIYAETTDLMAVDPYEMIYRKARPEKNGYFASLGKIACEPRPLITIPEAFTHKGVRYATPEEERIVVYSEISEGSKGIWYFVAGGKAGYKNNPALEKEIGKINGELQVLKRFLKIGEPVKWAEADMEKVRTDTILVRHKAVILILINQDYENSFEEGEKPFTYTPKENFKVTVHIPEWMQIKQIYEVGGEFVKNVPYETKENKLIIPVNRLDITRQFILTTDPNDYKHDTDGDGLPDIIEVSISGTHPDKWEKFK